VKVELNLAHAESRHERYALEWAVPAVVLGLAGLVYIGHSATREVRRYRDVHVKLAVLEGQDKSLREREAALRRELDQPKFREVYRQVQFVNKLIDMKQLSVTELAARVTKLLPIDARLAGLTLSQHEEELSVRLIIDAKSEEAVEGFISHLEDSPDFKDPVIANQGFEEQGSGAGAGEVVVTCYARYLPGAR